MTEKVVRGAMGEAYIHELLSRYGFSDVQYSTDPMDQFKDLSAEYVFSDRRVTIEVKTQALFYARRAFTLKDSQLRKCDECDYFIVLITKTDTMPDNDLTKKVYVVNSGFKREWSEWSRKTQRCVVPLEQDRVKFLCEIDNAAYEEICKTYGGSY